MNPNTFLDYDTAHDIVHGSSGNSSSTCPLCNGTNKKEDAQALAGKVIENNMNRRKMLRIEPGYGYVDDLLGGELNSKARNNLSDGDFAYIDSKGKRHLPIHDASHVRNALARFNHTQFANDTDKSKAKAKIDAAAKKFGIDVTKASEVKTTGVVIDVMKFAEGDSLPEWIQLVPIGEWNTVKYGKITITKDMLDQMATNFSAGLRAGNEAPIDIDHCEGPYGSDAAGWIKEVKVQTDGLWGKTEWNKLGTELLTNKIYKFLSPEFNLFYPDPLNADEIVPNVLIAASLVNRPLFRNLKPLVCSEVNDSNLTKPKSGSILITEPMKTEEIVLKPVDSLTAEEKDFLKVHASELTTEQKKTYGFSDEPANTDPKPPVEPAQPAAPDAAISGKDQVITISASEVKKLKEQAAEGQKAFMELKKKGLEETVKAWTFSEKGMKVAPAQKDAVVDFMLTLTEDQVKKFSEIMSGLPAKEIVKENGHDTNLTVGDLASTLRLTANELVTAGKAKDYREAVQLAIKTNPDLADYNKDVK